MTTPTPRRPPAISRALALFAAATCGALAVFAISWRSPTLLGFALAGAVIFGARGRRRLRAVAAALVLAAIPALLGRTIDELNATSQAIHGRYLAGGPAAVPVAEKLAVYQLGLWMVAMGAPLFPEVALEHALMMWPGPERRTFESDFATRSASIREPLAAWRAGLDAGGLTTLHRRVSWSYATADSARVALALNSCDLRARATRAGEGWAVEASAEVEISYPRSFALPLFTWAGRTFVVEEGLYRMLEDAGWYHPYVAVWRW